MDRISRARLSDGRARRGGRVVAAPLAPAFAAPNPQEDDLGFVGFAATAELVLLALYGRALNTKVLSPAERTHVQHMRGTTASTTTPSCRCSARRRRSRARTTSASPKGTFDSARAILREAVTLERMLVGTLVTGLAATQDDETRLLLARILESDSVHLSAARSALRSGTGLRARAALVRSASRTRGSSSTRTSASRASTTRRRVHHHVPEVRPMLRPPPAPACRPARRRPRRRPGCARLGVGPDRLGGGLAA